MRTVIVALTAAALVAMWSGSGWGQSFGKNKVTRSRFEWSYLETAHFDVYFYEGEEELARMAGTKKKSLSRWEIRRLWKGCAFTRVR